MINYIKSIVFILVIVFSVIPNGSFADEIPACSNCSDDYPFKDSIPVNCSGFVADIYGFYYGQCTSFVAWRMNRDHPDYSGNPSNFIEFKNWMSGIQLGNAEHWDSAANEIEELTVSNVPVVGAIAQWDPMETWHPIYGHVAYVVEVDGEDILIEEYNWPSSTHACGYNRRWVYKTPGTTFPDNAPYPSNFIIFNEPPPAYFWSGNGSVISYNAENENIPLPEGQNTHYGINGDVIWIRPQIAGQGDGTNPVGYFQWQVNENGCGKLKIDAPDRKISSVMSEAENHIDITVGTWNEREHDQTIYDVQLPFVLDLSQFGYNTYTGNWWMVQVAFRNPVSSSFRLEARCTNEASGSYTHIQDNPVTYEGQAWAGNGSVLSHTFQNVDPNQPGGASPGTFVDYLFIHPSTEASFVMFQWEYSSTRSYLKIDAKESSLTFEQKKANIFIRSWDSRGNGESTEEVTYLNVLLPITIGNLDIPASTVGDIPWTLKNKDWLQIKVRMLSPNIRTAIEATVLD